MNQIPALFRKSHGKCKTLVLSFLACMLVAGCAGVFSVRPARPASHAYPAEYLELLSKYATPGGIRYGEWKRNRADVAKLKRVVAFYARSSAPARPRMEALAWNLNAYNAAVLAHVLDAYPMESPLAEDPRFFERKTIVVGGKRMTLHKFKQKVIRPIFLEPRIHFALTAASRGGPRLPSHPYLGATLDAELDRLASQFVNNHPEGVRTRGPGPVGLSSIFMWYASDFGGELGRMDFINRYLPNPLSKGVPVEILPYNWALDEAPETR